MELVATHPKDFLPDHHEYFTYIKKVVRHRCRQSGFRRISTSLLENYADCEKAYGDMGKLVGKPLCVVESNDGSEKQVVRFDPTMSLARAYVENDMKDWPQPVELYYIDTFLHTNEEGKAVDSLEFGIGVLGADDPALDAQVIYLASKILEDLGLKELYTVQINHIGSHESRAIYTEDLKNFYFDKERSLCECCVEMNQAGKYLELLRCKEEDCAILSQLAPKLENYLTENDKERYTNLKEYLEELGVIYHENKAVVGIDSYNSNTVFEFWHNDKGASHTIFFGGSNDDHIENLGSEKTISIGFSSNSEILMNDMKEIGITVPHKDHIQVFVAQLGKNAKKKSLSLLEKLREVGVQAVGAMGTGSMRIQLDMASSFGVKYSLLMGEIEVKEGMVIIRDMSVGTQESVPYDKVVEIMQDRIGKEKMDLMEEEEKSRDLKSKTKKKS